MVAGVARAVASVHCLLPGTTVDRLARSRV